MKMGSTQASADQRIAVIARRLQIISRRTLPLFARIGNDRFYATRLVRAIKEVDFARVEQRIKQVMPNAAAVSVGAGFSAGLNLGTQTFDVGIFRPGHVIRTNDIQAVSRIMLPLLREIATDRSFARRVAKQFVRRRQAALLRSARTVVSAERVGSATIDNYGFSFVVRLPAGASYNFVYGIME